MNTQSLVAHKKLLAIIIGVAIIATAGMSAASAQTSPSGHTRPTITGSINIEQTLMSKVTVTFAAASTTAAGGSTASPITGGQVISGSLKPMQGYLVYAFKVIDSNNKVYSVIVDPSSGAVLYASTGHTFHGFGMGGHGMGHARGMMHGHHMGAGAWKSQNATSSTTTNPADWTTNGLQ
ncbi:MAG: PepSY domain-containing protein [Nitrosotalea sp.]